jgi:hypothetical protein
MPNQKYLCMYRSAPAQSQASAPKPQASPAQMQEMFAAFQKWQEKFKDNIVNMGDQLKPTGRILTAAGVTDGPFAESKEIIAGFMILSAADYAEAVAVVEAMPSMQMPGACIEIREMAGR